MFKISLDKDKCIGCGSCAAVCPGNYEMDEDGKAMVLKSPVETLGCNKLAEENCPNQAIVVEPLASPSESSLEEE